MKKLLIFLFIIAFTGCTPRACQSLDRDFQFSNRNYLIEQYAGDSLVHVYKFHGILNQETGSDGHFFEIGDTLYEVSGSINIKSWN